MGIPYRVNGRLLLLMKQFRNCAIVRGSFQRGDPMKTILKLTTLSLLLLSSLSALAVDGHLIRGCRTTIVPPASVFPAITVKTRIYSHGSGIYSVRISSQIAGQNHQEVEIHPVQVITSKLDENFMAKNSASMSLGEKLLFQRKELDQKINTTSEFRSRVSWNSVRQAKIFLFQNEASVPMALVEAQDAAGNTMDTFMGGSVIGLCR